MKKLLLLVIVLAVLFAVVERHRLFVRDPLANVVRNGAKEQGAQVFINVDNDVLLENDNQPLYVELIQHGQPIGPPAVLKCVHWLACLTNADKATLAVVNPGSQLESMQAKSVTFRDTGKRETVVTLY